MPMVLLFPRSQKESLFEQEERNLLFLSNNNSQDQEKEIHWFYSCDQGKVKVCSQVIKTSMDVLCRTFRFLLWELMVWFLVLLISPLKKKKSIGWMNLKIMGKNLYLNKTLLIVNKNISRFWFLSWNVDEIFQSLVKEPSNITLSKYITMFGKNKCKQTFE